jgi:hypothetical protein
MHDICTTNHLHGATSELQDTIETSCSFPLRMLKSFDERVKVHCILSDVQRLSTCFLETTCSARVVPMSTICRTCVGNL